jgi:integrase
LVLFFGSRDARKLCDSDIRHFAARMMEKRSASVAQGCLSTLRRILNLAVKSGLLERNPVPEIAEVMRACRNRGATEVTQPDAWTREEVAALLELAQAHEPHFYPALRFALATGARRGELLALRWEDIDLERRRVHFRRTAKPRGGTKVPKSNRDRLTPLAPGIAEMLSRQLTEQRKAAKWHGRPEPEWVFASPKGRPWAERNFERTWYRLRDRAVGKKVRPLKLHCTRHTFITWALEAGVPAKRVAEWVGASVAVIEQHYKHVIPTIADDMGFLETRPNTDRTEPN